MTVSGANSAASSQPPAPGEPERALSEAASREQLQDLYRDHSPGLLRQLTRMTGCREIARELTQEAFLRLLRMAPGTLVQIEQPEAYLSRVSTNLLRDWGRANVRIQRSKADLELTQETTLDQVAALESRDTLHRLEAAIAKLKPRTREVFLAHRIDGLSYAEIADRTGLSIKGVEKQMGKAIAKIDRLLDRA